MLEITCINQSEDFKLFKSVINQGIDARLEGFTKSKFKFSEISLRWYLNFDDSEISILLRRLSELETDEADQWIDDIVNHFYGIEII